MEDKDYIDMSILIFSEMSVGEKLRVITKMKESIARYNQGERPLKPVSEILAEVLIEKETPDITLYKYMLN